MESDISLIEISGEDDSLLQQIPNDEALTLNNSEALTLNNSEATTSSNDNFFLCSPLQTIRSNFSNTDSSIHLPSDGNNKENLNANKLEVSKLSIEPHQMKKKKKGGGYNLRKSLAWDRAFFTDEGVLDPLELSMISGNLTTSRRDMLSVIHEEGTESSSGSLGCSSDPADLHALKEKLYKELPTNTLNGVGKNGSCLVSKHGSSTKQYAPPTSAVKRKVLSAQDVSRSASKRSGCLRTVASLSYPSTTAASLSLKRPAVNTTKSTATEEKATKIKVPRSDLTVLSRTVRSAHGPSDSKHNQVAQRAAVGVQKNAVLKESPKIKSSVNNAKAGTANKSLLAKTSMRQVRRNLASSVLKKDPATVLPREPISEGNNGLETITSSLNPSSCHPLNDHDGGSSKVAVSHPQNVPHAGGNMQPAHIQMAKPSGLRMPSRSLGFFDQKTVPSLHSQSQSSYRPYNLSESNIPNLRSLGGINPIHGPRTLRGRGKSGKVADVEATKTNRVVLCSSSGGSTPFAVNPTLHDKLKSISEATTTMKKVEAKFADVCPRSTDLTMHELENPHPASQLTLAMRVHEVSRRSDVIEPRLVEGKLFNLSAKNYGVSPESCFGDISHSGSQKISRVLRDQSSSASYDNEQHQEQDAFIEPSAGTVNQISHDSEGLRKMNGNSLNENRTSEDLKTNSGREKVDICPKVQECSVSNIEASCVSSHHEHSTIEQAEGDGDGVCNMRRSHAGDAPGSCSNCNLVDDSCISFLWSSAVNNLHSTSVNDEKPDIPNSCLDGERYFQEDISHLNDCSLHQKSFSSDDSQPEEVFQNVDSCISKGNSAYVSESKSPYVLSLAPHPLADSGLDAAINMECLPAEDTLLDYLDSKPVVDVSNYDTETRHGIKNLDPNSSVDFVVIQQEGQIGELATASANVCPNPGDLSPSDLKISLISSLLIAGLQHGDKEDEQYYSQGKDDFVILNLQPGDDIDYSHLDRSLVQIDTSSSKYNGSDSIEQSNVTENVESSERNPAEDFPSDSLDGKPEVDASNYDTKSRHDTKHFDQNTSVELDMTKEGQIGKLATASANVSPYPGESSPNELVNPLIASLLSPGLQHGDKEDEQCYSQVKDDVVIPNLQPGDDIGYSQLGLPLVQIDTSSSQHNGSDSIESANVVISGSYGADKISYEAQNSDASQGVLFEKDQFLEEPQTFDDNAADFSKSGLESPQCLSQQVYLGKANNEVAEGNNEVDGENNEVDGVNNTMKKSLEGDEVLHPLEGRLLSPISACNLSTSMAEILYPIVDAAIAHAGHMELQNPCRRQVFQGNNDISCSNEDLNPNSEECREKNVDESAIEQCPVVCESEIVNERTQVAPTLHYDGLDEEKEAKHKMEEAITYMIEIEASVENLKCSTISRNDGAHSNQDIPEFESSPTTTENLTSRAAVTSNYMEFCSLSEEPESSESIDQTESGGYMKDNELKNDISLEKYKSSQNDDAQNSNRQPELVTSICTTDNKDETEQLKISRNDGKEAPLVIKPSPNVVPFSEEWLAAIEAAGEEILTMKSGAVQHSPPDKSQPEPGPWSPVKRKNNQGIGPFDCTKYTNTTNIPPEC